MSTGGDVAAGSQELALGHLAEAVNEGLRQGREPDVEQLVREHPALTESIRQLVPALVLLHHIGHEGDAKYEGARSVAAETSCAGQLGDFQIIREIGRGGMGIVYEAEQLSLRRRVALKVLPFAAVLDQRQLRRFKNEAQAAALLHHQNIVPVHGVGCERGVHYYAMQYVEGQSLDHVIASMRTLGGFDAAPAGSADPRGAPEPIVPAPRRASGQLQSKAHPWTPADATAAYSPAAAELSTSREIVGAALPTEHPAAESEHRQRTSPASATAREIKGFRSTERSCNQPAYFRSIAEVGIQVAEALEHAHVEGVVHRDIKPSNLILDSRGKVWVTDFGLARVESDCGLTKTGDLIGTLRYMSPEQALANRVIVDHRADIYSLGATLYELMTLEPVFGGQDRHELLRQIAFEEPRPPRRINSDVPQELETIVLKAMAKNPDERYAVAQEFADDLNRFLDDKPIWAKPPTLMHRARKMARRHKHVAWTVGACTALLMVLSIIGLAASNVWISQERDAKGAALREKADALTEASTQQQAAESARAEAIANLKTARQAVDQMLTRVGEQRLADIPQMEQVRRQLLEDALSFYQSFHQEHSNDPEIRLETALAHARLGTIYAMLGQRVEAEQALRDGITKLEKMHDETLLDTGSRESLNNLHSSLAGTLWNLGRRDECIEESRRAVAQAEQLAADYPDARYKHRLADRCAELGWYLYLHRPDEAEGLFRRAIGLASTHGDRRALAQVYSSLASSLINTERWTEAEVPVSHALDIWQSLVKEQPGNISFQCELANTLTGRGVVFEKTGRFSEAELAYREALAIGEKLTTEFPTVPGHRTSVAYFHCSLGNLLRGRDAAHAAEHIRKALAIYERLVADFPSVPDYRETLFYSYIDTGRVMAAIGRTQEAVETIGKAISIQERLEEELSNKLTYWGQLARSHIELGRVLADSGRAAEADAEFRNAVVVSEKLEADFGGKPDYRADLGVTQSGIGFALARAGRPGETLPVFRFAIKHYEKLVTDLPDANHYRWLLACCHRRIGVSLASLGQTRDAEAAYREAITHGADSCSVWAHLAAAQLALGDMDGYRKSCARLLDGYGQNEHWKDANTVAWFCVLIPDSGVDFAKVVQVAERALARDDPYSTSYRHDSLNTLGVALYRAGRFQESIARLDEAIAAHAKGGNAWDWLFLAMAHERLGQTTEARQWYERSVEWIEQNRTTLEKRKTQWEELRRFHAEARALLKQESEALKQELEAKSQ